jgi:hypothetical protein
MAGMALDRSRPMTPSETFVGRGGRALCLGTPEHFGLLAWAGHAGRAGRRGRPGLCADVRNPTVFRTVPG